MRTITIILLVIMSSCAKRESEPNHANQSAVYLSRMNKMMYDEIKSNIYISIVNNNSMEYVATAINQFNIATRFTKRLIDQYSAEGVLFEIDSILIIDPGVNYSDHIDSNILKEFAKQSIYCYDRYYNILEPKFKKIEQVPLDSIYAYKTDSEKRDIEIFCGTHLDRLKQPLTLSDALLLIQEWTNDIIYAKKLQLEPFRYYAKDFTHPSVLRQKNFGRDSIKFKIDFCFADTSNNFWVRYTHSKKTEDDKYQTAYTLNGLTAPAGADTIYGYTMFYQYDRVEWKQWKVAIDKKNH